MKSILRLYVRNEKSTAVQGKKLYTVLPPPEGYLINSEEDLVTPSNPNPIDSVDSPAAHPVHIDTKGEAGKSQ
ncbi:hypothetical protein cypCar_00008468 [Cyprinus carpio]|nr:hypothetical protein cypCar_00008468 [Cyprinus carpio]